MKKLLIVFLSGLILALLAGLTMVATGAGSRVGPALGSEPRLAHSLAWLQAVSRDRGPGLADALRTAQLPHDWEYCLQKDGEVLAALRSRDLKTPKVDKAVKSGGPPLSGRPTALAVVSASTLLPPPRRANSLIRSRDRPAGAEGAFDLSGYEFAGVKTV